jgi:hypothetical protein
MITKQSISLLVVSTLLVLPGGMAIAGNIDVQTGNMRATIAPNRSVNVKTGQTSATISPKRSPMPNYRRQNGHIRNSQIRYNPATVKPQVKRTRNTCNGGSYSHQSTQTTVSNGGVSRTYSSASTMCR